MTTLKAKASEYISLKQAARMLNYSEGHLHRLVQAGNLPAIQRQKHCPLRFKRTDIEAKKAEWGR